MNVLLAGYSVHDKPLELTRYKLMWYLIRLQKEGVSEAIVNGQSYMLGPGDLLICKPGDFYKMRVGEIASNSLPSTDYFLKIRPDDSWVTEWFHRFEQACRANIVLDEKLLNLWEHIIYETRQNKNVDKDIVDYLCRALLLTISRHIGSVDKNNRELAVSIKIKDYIEKNSTKPVTLRGIAAHVNLSIPRVSEIFKASFGQSIMDYVIEARISMAKKLIAISDLKLCEIALICGFPNYTHFNRTFKARTGQSPSQYEEHNKAHYGAAKDSEDE